MKILMTSTRSVRGVLAAAASLVLLSGCATANPDLNAGDRLGDKSVEDSITDYFAALAEKDTARIESYLAIPEDVDTVYIPETAPELIEVTSETQENPRAVDYKFSTATAKLKIADKTYEWDISLKMESGDNPHWVILNAVESFTTPMSRGGEITAKPAGQAIGTQAGASTPPSTSNPYGYGYGSSSSETINVLAGVHKFTPHIENKYVKADDKGVDIAIPPIPDGSDDSGKARELIESIDADAKVALSKASLVVTDTAKTEIKAEVEELITKCKNWCQQGYDETDFNTVDLSKPYSVSSSKGIFKFSDGSTAPDEFRVVPWGDDAWLSDLTSKYYDADNAPIMIEIKPLSIDYTKATCGGAQTCSADSNITTDNDVMFLFKVKGDEVDFLAIAGNE